MNTNNEERVIQTDAPYPVQLQIPRPEYSSRWLALATLLFLVPKAILLIPHLVIVYLLQYVAIFLGIIAQFVVLFTGKYPEGMFNLMRGIFQWHARVGAFFFGLTDKYPPFSFK